MSIFSGITNALGLTTDPTKTQFKYTTPEANAGLFSNMQGDTNALRGLAQTPITGISAGGQAMQDFARNAFAQQKDQMLNSGLASQATAQANMARYGTDAGAMERLNTGLGRDRMLANQRMAGQQATSMADLASQDINRQQQNQFTALSALPMISQSQYGQSFDIANNQAGIKNQFNALNQGNRMQAEAGNKGIMSSLGGAIGSGFGPIGTIAGNVLGGLFS